MRLTLFTALMLAASPLLPRPLMRRPPLPVKLLKRSR